MCIFVKIAYRPNSFSVVIHKTCILKHFLVSEGSEQDFTLFCLRIFQFLVTELIHDSMCFTPRDGRTSKMSVMPIELYGVTL
jgi:hypothetical protein